jgi:HEPN domain-containing protein
MQISGSTLDVLADIVTGGNDREKHNYRGGKALVNFFYGFGSKDIYGSDFPSRKDYTYAKLQEYNGTDVMREIIKEVLDPVHYNEQVPNNEDASKLNRYLRKDGFQLIPEKIDSITDDTGWHTWGDFLIFDVQPLGERIVATQVVAKLNHQFINAQIDKANEKMANGDYDGAITNCYSLVEKLIKELLRESGCKFKQDEGDIRSLYKQLAEAMNLNPKGENIESYLKSILEGLKQQISGLFNIANKASDRHARKYKPSRHHAKLAVNVAFTLCEFLLDSYEYQQNLKTLKAPLANPS